MPVQVHCLKPGDKLYGLGSRRVGDTDVYVDTVQVVHVVDVSHDKRMVRLRTRRDDVISEFAMARSDLEHSRQPREWLQLRAFTRRQCYLCRAYEGDGHKLTCDHPKAKRERAREKSRRTRLLAMTV